MSGQVTYNTLVQCKYTLGLVIGIYMYMYMYLSVYKSTCNSGKLLLLIGICLMQAGCQSLWLYSYNVHVCLYGNQYNYMCTGAGDGPYYYEVIIYLL